MEVRQVNITLLKERKLASVYEKQKPTKLFYLM